MTAAYYFTLPIWVQIHSAAQFMDFSVKVTSKRPNTASHDVNDRVRNMVFLDMLAARFQRSNVIIDCLCRPNLRNINFETVGIVEFKLVVIDLCHALKFALIHAAIAISFAGNMIFDVLFMLMVLCELINERFITTVCSQTLCTDKVYVLHFFF